MVKTPVSRMARWAAVALIAASTGCGYTNRSMLPEHIRTIHVLPVANGIDLSREISHKERFRVYRPGLEVDVTNALVNRFIFDGTLKVVSSPDKADSILEAKLIDYRRDPLRYNDSEEVQEYRLNIVLDVTLRENGPGGKVLWHSAQLTGDTTFYLSGSRAVSEDEALVKVIEDVARRVVESTVEVW